MIEIKFRLRKGNRVVGYERWNSLAEKWCYDSDSTGVFDIRNPFIPHTDKDEYTGLLDINSKEIYEGDIIKGSDGTHQIVWCDEMVCFGTESPRYNGTLVAFTSIICERSEVIGNVYENKELLDE